MYGLTEAFRSTYLDPRCSTSIRIRSERPFPSRKSRCPSRRLARSAGRAGGTGSFRARSSPKAIGTILCALRNASSPPRGSRYGGTAVWSGRSGSYGREGLLYFVGRADAMIKTSGNRVSPTEVEEAAIASGFVAEAVALGCPTIAWRKASRSSPGPAPPHQGREAEAQLRNHLKRQLPNFMQPSIIVWRDELPKSPNGKLDRERLKSELMA
jgi:acyl-coenzyme A synthetase/AMP-(fatty) acid ligase